MTFLYLGLVYLLWVRFVIGFEFEGSLICLEVVIVYFFEENEVFGSSGKYRMFEGKDCGGGDAFFNGIKKYRYGGSDSI